MHYLYLRRLIKEVLSSSSSPSKVIFMAGSPGSGKSTFLRSLGSLLDDFIQINPDTFFEKSLQDMKISMNIGRLHDDYEEIKELRNNSPEVPNPYEEEYLELREKLSKIAHAFNNAKKSANNQIDDLLESSSNLIIDGTGGNFPVIKRQIDRFKSLGYDVGMIFIDVPLEVSLERNLRRERQLSSGAIERSHRAVSDNKNKYSTLLGDNFFYVDNSKMNDDMLASFKERLRNFLSK